MIYSDDQCVRCGEIRVSKSTLCARCEAAAVGEKLVKIDSLVKENQELDEKCKKMGKLCEQLLDHVIDNSMYAGELEKAIHLVWLKNWKDGQNEKDRLQVNK